MKSKFAALFVFILLTSTGFSQTKAATFSADCSDAVELVPNGKYHFDKAPQGYGQIKEFSNNPPKSLYYFENETHSAWITFVMPTSGKFTFKIAPDNYAADFDFLLFAYTDENFCSDLTAGRLMPVRSNISRFDTLEGSITGLAVTETAEFVHSGPGANFSMALEVEKGQRYYLVINNVYGTETAFNIRFTYYGTGTVSGIVKDKETGEPVKGATVTWEEKTGEVLATTTTNHETGRFQMEVPIQKGRNPKEYILAASKKNYFFVETTVLASTREPLVPINLAMPRLKKGINVTMKNILFVGGRAIPLKSSRHSLRRLYKLMKNNSTLAIRIEGHINNDTLSEWGMNLSEARAERVEKYLIDKGVSEKRLSTIGYDCSRVLYSSHGPEKLQRLNRRVEIMVVNF